MATSSITANFAIKDPMEARAFVKAFLSAHDDASRPRRQRSGVKCQFISGVDELKRYRRSLRAHR